MTGNEHICSGTGDTNHINEGSPVGEVGMYFCLSARCRGCGPYECASIVSTRGRPGLAELGRARKEGKCRGVGESRKLEAQLKMAH